VNRNPDYEKDSEEFRKVAEKITEKALREARTVISGTLTESAETIVNIMRNSDEEIRRESSAKHLLKLGGLEIERQQIIGGIRLNITERHLDKVLKAADGETTE